MRWRGSSYEYARQSGKPQYLSDTWSASSMIPRSLGRSTTPRREGYRDISLSSGSHRSQSFGPRDVRVSWRAPRVRSRTSTGHVSGVSATRLGDRDPAPQTGALRMETSNQFRLTKAPSADGPLPRREHIMPKKEAKLDLRSQKLGEDTGDSFVAWVKGVEMSLDADDGRKLGDDTVKKVVNWIKGIEAHLENYYVDTLEIDLGMASPFAVGGKLTIRNKKCLPTGFPRT